MTRKRLAIAVASAVAAIAVIVGVVVVVSRGEDPTPVAAPETTTSTTNGATTWNGDGCRRSYVRDRNPEKDDQKLRILVKEGTLFKILRRFLRF